MGGDPRAARGIGGGPGDGVGQSPPRDAARFGEARGVGGGAAAATGPKERRGGGGDGAEAPRAAPEIAWGLDLRWVSLGGTPILRRSGVVLCSPDGLFEGIR